MSIKNILIVDDEKELRELMAEMIGQEGFHCLQAKDGKEASEILEKETIDLLITDMRMPRMDGAQLLAWCRHKHLHFPVIFITANVELLPHDEVALSDCCAALLRKPISIDVLIEAIKAADQRNHHRLCAI